MGKKNFDIACVGAGPAGILTAVSAARKFRKRCCVIDEASHLGGCCVNEGCVPTKLMCFQSSRKESPINLDALHRAKNAARDLQREAMRQLLEESGVEFISGRAKITGPHSIEVDSGTMIEAGAIVIAVGAESSTLPGIAIDGETVLSSTSCMELREVPGSLAIIGAGSIGLELGSIWQRLGASVTLIDVLTHIGSYAVDEGVAAEYKDILEMQGLQFVLGVEVLGIERKRSVGAVIHVHEKETQKEKSITADKVLMAVGRKPLTANLGLQEVGVELDRRGAVVVDSSTGQSKTVPSIFACGDCTPGPMVAHRATLEASRIAEFICTGKKPAANEARFEVLPNVIYTQPELAWAGKPETQLRSEGVKLAPVRYLHFVSEMRNTLCPNLSGVAKIVSEEETGRLLHVSLISTTAGDMIGEAVLAIRLGVSVSEFGNVPHAHPVYKTLLTMLDLGF